MAVHSFLRPFPWDVTAIIIAHLETVDLLAVSRVTRDLGAEAESILYEIIEIKKDNVRRCCESIVDCPRRAAYVTKFHVDMVPRLDEDLVTRTLLSLPNLIDLSFHLRSAGHPSFVLPPITPNLNAFSTNISSMGALLPFLRGQPMLQSFIAMRLNEDVQAAARETTAPILPVLRRFSGSHQAAMSLVPGRPVTSVEIIRWVDAADLPSMCKALARSSSVLTLLSIRMIPCNVDLLKIIAHHLPTLRSLTLFDPKYTLMNAPSRPPHSDALPSFPCLEEFCVMKELADGTGIVIQQRWAKQGNSC